jgi:CheY-like chemotaxis protein
MAKSKTGSHKKTIMIVDDEIGILEVLDSILTDAGYNVITAMNGREAVARLDESRPDLVLMDFMMPMLDGAGVLQYMRSHDGLKAIPVILASALSENTIRERCTGYNAFLRKPFKTGRLMEHISKLLGPPADNPKPRKA